MHYKQEALQQLQIDFITREHAYTLINACHYSKVMPRITKDCIGGFREGELVAVMTLGWGTRPQHTIRKCFPSLSTADYLELGKLCLRDTEPYNSESHFIRMCLQLIKRKYPNLKLLYSWADGIIGKPGYVYQASNFWYGGYIWTEMYLNESDVRVHPRTIQGLSIGPRVGKMKSRSYAITTAMGYTKYFGLQFRYVYPLCSKRDWKMLRDESPFIWQQGGYPKKQDCLWQKQATLGHRISCERPPFTITEYIQK